MLRMGVLGSKETETVSDMLNEVTAVTERGQHLPVILSGSFITGINICLPTVL